MSQQHLSNGKPIKILWFGDLVNPSGFGRIGNEITKRMHFNNWQVIGASIPWAGYPWNSLPFQVWGMGGQDIWNRVTGLARTEQPDIIVCCQDFPYAHTLFHGCKIDWSVTKLIIVTPIDGVPVEPSWAEMVGLADATMIISRFGVEAMRLAGHPTELLHPGVDTKEFYPAESQEEVNAYREKLGIPADAFVIGSFMMNQGRKMVSKTIEVFKEFALDKPDAYLFLDMEKASGGGWDTVKVCQQVGLGLDKVRWREDALKAGMMGLRERYLLCDLTSQMAHREGFGLPNLESMAHKIPPTVLDWCSGSELAGQGRGILVRRIDYMEQGTWGGAKDAFPDVKNWISQWCRLYRNREELKAIGAKGYEWAIQQTWDQAYGQFEAVLNRVVATHRKDMSEYDASKQFEPKPGITLSDQAGPAHDNRSDTSLQLPGGQTHPDGGGVKADNGRPAPNPGDGRPQPELQPDGNSAAQQSVEGANG
jgi:glycosyltransferase involved in cell wall biosynthesis